MESSVWNYSALPIQFSGSYKLQNAVGISAWRAEFPDAGHYEAEHVNDVQETSI